MLIFYYEFQAFDMTDHGVKAYIFLPDETANIGASTKPDVRYIQDDIYWEINVHPTSMQIYNLHTRTRENPTRVVIDDLEVKVR